MLQNSTFNLKIICSLTVKHAFGLLCSHHIFSCLELLFAHWQCVILNIHVCLLFVHFSCKNLLNTLKSQTFLFCNAIPRPSSQTESYHILKLLSFKIIFTLTALYTLLSGLHLNLQNVCADSTSHSPVCSVLKMHFWSFQARQASHWQHKILFLDLQNVCAQPALCWRCIFKQDDLHTDGIILKILSCLASSKSASSVLKMKDAFYDIFKQDALHTNGNHQVTHHLSVYAPDALHYCFTSYI